MEGDSLKALPTSRVAEALRRYQELAVLAAADQTRPPFMRGVASVADAFIGRAPEGLDDIASGMARLRRPAQHESWVSANQPMLDAVGLAPVGGGPAKASFMGAKMLRAVGRGREHSEAAEYLMDKGEAPLGWILHPGGRGRSTSHLMKYEPPKLKKDVAWETIAKAQPQQDKNFEYLYEPTDFFAAYKGATGRDLRFVPRDENGGNVLGSYSPQHDQVKIGRAFRKRIDGKSERFADLELTDLLAHELTHAGQAASGLPRHMRGGSSSQWDWGGSYDLPDWGRNLDLRNDPTNVIAEEILLRRLGKRDMAGLTPMQMYEANPGETIARMAGLLASAEDAAGGWSTAVRNNNLRRQMRQGDYSKIPLGTPILYSSEGLGATSRTYQTVEELLEETRLLQKRLDAQRAAKRQKGTP